jgi:hypothetical protein
LPGRVRGVTIGGRQRTRCRLGAKDHGCRWMVNFVARIVAELRAMPQAEDLLGRLGRVVEATRTVVGWMAPA